MEVRREVGRPSYKVISQLLHRSPTGPGDHIRVESQQWNFRHFLLSETRFHALPRSCRFRSRRLRMLFAHAHSRSRVRSIALSHGVGSCVTVQKLAKAD